MQRVSGGNAIVGVTEMVNLVISSGWAVDSGGYIGGRCTLIIRL